jgi:hypothetical protein
VLHLQLLGHQQAVTFKCRLTGQPIANWRSPRPTLEIAHDAPLVRRLPVQDPNIGSFHTYRTDARTRAANAHEFVVVKPRRDPRPVMGSECCSQEQLPRRRSRGDDHRALLGVRDRHDSVRPGPTCSGTRRALSAFRCPPTAGPGIPGRVGADAGDRPARGLSQGLARERRGGPRPPGKVIADLTAAGRSVPSRRSRPPRSGAMTSRTARS